MLFYRMKQIAVILCCCTANLIQAQTPVEELNRAEIAFAALSATTTTQNAFLHYLDTGAVGFSNGRFVNLYNEWKGRNTDSTKLTWGPQFSIISADGGMGINTGPWEFRIRSLSDTAVAHGFFASVWKKQPGIGWKVVFDQGTGYPLHQHSTALPRQIISSPASPATGKDPEQEFIAAYTVNAATALKAAMLPSGWLMLEGFPPFGTPEAIAGAAAHIPGNLSFEPAGNFRSSAGDLLAVYGTAMDGSRPRPYLRVWCQQNGKWRLALMVLA